MNSEIVIKEEEDKNDNLNDNNTSMVKKHENFHKNTKSKNMFYFI